VASNDPGDIPVTALGEHLGGETTDLDARRIGSDISLDVVKSLLFEHQLLCFRDQQLTPQELLDFTRLFGKPDPHVLQQFALPGFPDIVVLSNIVEKGRLLGNRKEGFGWHTDLTYMAQPAAYTILYALEVPPESGDTLFASLYKAYDTLDEDEKQRLRPLKGRYSYLELYNKRDHAEPLSEEQRARTPDVFHPLVRLHPETGREGMYLNLDDCIGIDGGEDAEGLNLVKRLFDYTINNFQYRHRWRPRDLLIWDNRGALHTATPYDMERHRRLVYRTSVRGEVPIGLG
jgi:taurine dioxygenase